jgi:hypothetical protein
MKALAVIQVLMFCKATTNKLETATNVLNELQNIKKNKLLPFLTIRRAIKMQERLINDLK